MHGNSQSTSLDLSEEQVLFFRALRSHLAGPGAPSAADAALDILGAQAQQPNPALHALSLRTAGRPTAATLERALLQEPRTLVRSWGQRGTLHIYAPDPDWALVVAARPLWEYTLCRNPVPTEVDLVPAREALKTVESATRADFAHLVSDRFAKEVAGLFGEDGAHHFGAGRLLWRLAEEGVVCLGEKRGSEQAYAARAFWFPNLRWPDPLPAAREAAVTLARRYLAVHGPATIKDVAHHFGSKVRTARTWIDDLRKANELVDVRCGGRKGLVALQRDVEALSGSVPQGRSAWPLRLLPKWDTLLMGHSDKSWTVPVEADRKRIWRSAARVEPVALSRGRAVAIWSHTVKRRRLQVKVDPLSGWKAREHLQDVRSEATALAAHLEVGDAEVTVTA